MEEANTTRGGTHHPKVRTSRGVRLRVATPFYQSAAPGRNSRCVCARACFFCVLHTAFQARHPPPCMPSPLPPASASLVVSPRYGAWLPPVVSSACSPCSTTPLHPLPNPPPSHLHRTRILNPRRTESPPLPGHRHLRPPLHHLHSRHRLPLPRLRETGLKAPGASARPARLALRSRSLSKGRCRHLSATLNRHAAEAQITLYAAAAAAAAGFVLWRDGLAPRRPAPGARRWRRRAGTARSGHDVHGIRSERRHFGRGRGVHSASRLVHFSAQR